jgi:hypothetical protein
VSAVPGPCCAAAACKGQVYAVTNYVCGCMSLRYVLQRLVASCKVCALASCESARAPLRCGCVEARHMQGICSDKICRQLHVSTVCSEPSCGQVCALARCVFAALDVVINTPFQSCVKVWLCVGVRSMQGQTMYAATWLRSMYCNVVWQSVCIGQLLSVCIGQLCVHCA